MIEEFDAESVDRGRLRELAKRYAFLLFERYQLPFPFLLEGAVNDVRAFAGISGRELLLHPTMRLVLDGIENQSSFLAAG